MIEDEEKVLQVVHELRGQIAALQTEVHFFMTSDQRFYTEKLVEGISQKINSIWNHCLNCEKRCQVIDVKKDS